MNQQEGKILWLDACETTMGVDSDGDAVLSRTRFGTAATALGLSTWPGNPEKQEKIASFLRDWADAIEGGKR